MAFSQYFERPSYSQLLDRLEALARLDRWGDETSARRDPASMPAISEAERRLGAILPASYKRFLLCTNGYNSFMLSGQNLLPVEEIVWLSSENQDYIDAWQHDSHIADEDYYIYGDEQAPYNFRGEYLQSSLQISDFLDGGVYLLNPNVRSAGREWEAWHIAFWAAGAGRHRSFYDLLESQVIEFETGDVHGGA